MSPTWHGDAPPPEQAAPGLAGWLRAGARGVPVVIVLAGGVGLKALLRLVEAPLYGARRPVSPWVTVWVCRIVLACFGIRRRTEGVPDRSAQLLVANHASWLDIFVLNAVRPIYFVSKAEVAGWPGIGVLARITGTVFIARDPRTAHHQAEMLRERLAAGHRLMLFPEGTSTDGCRVLPFRSTLFGAVQATHMRVQPLTLAYRAPVRTDPRFYGWWGDMDLGPHLLSVLTAPRQGQATVIHHAAVPAEAMHSRKALAVAAETTVRAGLDTALRHQDTR